MSIIPELLHTRGDRKTCTSVSMLLQRKSYNRYSQFLFFTFPSLAAFIISLLSFLVTYTPPLHTEAASLLWMDQQWCPTQVRDPFGKPVGKLKALFRSFFFLFQSGDDSLTLLKSHAPLIEGFCSFLGATLLRGVDRTLPLPASVSGSLSHWPVSPLWNAAEFVDLLPRQTRTPKQHDVTHKCTSQWGSWKLNLTANSKLDFRLLGEL